MGTQFVKVRDQVPLEHARVENANRKMLVNLHRTFYFGDEMTDIESAVEQRYLTLKNFKAERFMKSKNNMFKMVYTEANFRRLTGIANATLRDVEYFDDLRQVYEVS